MRFVVDYVIFSLGIRVSVSLSLPKVLGGPAPLVGGPTMWVEYPKIFAEKVEKAVDMYNHDPHSNIVGPPAKFWHASKETWEFLIE